MMKVKNNKIGRNKLNLIPPIRKIYNRNHRTDIRKILKFYNQMVLDGTNRKEFEILFDIRKGRLAELKEFPLDNMNEELWSDYWINKTLLKALYHILKYLKYEREVTSNIYLEDRFSLLENLSSVKVKQIDNSEYEVYLDNATAEFYLFHIRGSGNSTVILDESEIPRGFKPHI